MKRLNRDLYFLAIARMVASRSTCLRLHVGAVLVNEDHHIISTGYCGAPRGMPHCTKDNCSEMDRCMRTVHAEVNAILFAPPHLPGEGGRTLYITHSPCDECAKIIIQAGIVRVVYMWKYPSHSSDFLDQAGINHLQYPEREVLNGIRDMEPGLRRRVDPAEGAAG